MGLPQAEAESQDPIEAFIARWAHPAPPSAPTSSRLPSSCATCWASIGRSPATGDPARDRYRFEYPVRFSHPDGSTSTGSIDLYRRDAFVMEAKQGSDQQLEEQLALFGGIGDPDAQRRRRPGHQELEHRHAGRPRSGRALRQGAPGRPRLAAVPDHRRRRPLLRALCRLQPDRQELQPVPGRPELPHPARRPARPEDPRAAPSDLDRPALPRPDQAGRRSHPRRLPSPRPRGARPGEGGPSAKAGGRLPHALPVLHVRRGRGPAAQGLLHQAAGDAARPRPAAVGLRPGDALGRDGPRRAVLLDRQRRRAALQRRPVPGTRRRCRSSPSFSAS